jgi:tripartite-type tricarboxylate transporter receptor subunit TctC
LQHRVLISLAAAVLISVPAMAQAPADFYRGKTISLLIGGDAGIGYDLYARLLARHIGEHIPGSPLVVPQNMAGAASLTLANYLYTVAPRNGLVFAAVYRATALSPLYGSGASAGARFDAQRFTWIGSIASETGVVLAMKSAGLHGFADLFSKELIVGAEGGGTADTELFARLTNSVLGTKARIVTGYKSPNEVLLAMERGEVNGLFVGGWTGIRDEVTPWLTSGKASLLVQLAVRPDAKFPNVPVIMDFASNERQRQILRLAYTPQLWGRPYVAPPDLPPERAKALRDAFEATMRDPAFLAEAQSMHYDVSPLAGEEIARLVSELYASPADVIEATRAAFRGE